MTNYICEGERMQVVAGEGGIISGEVVLVGTKATIAVISALEGETATVQTEGVFELTKGTGAIAQGDALYYDSTNKVVTKMAGGNTLVGYAFADALSAETIVLVTLTDNQSDTPTFSTVANIPAIAGTLTGSADGTIADITAAAGACAGGATPTAGNVDTAIATAVAPIIAGTNLQLKELQVKYNALLVALKAAGIMIAD